MAGKVGEISEIQKAILADPQTSGGLLIAVSKDFVEEVKDVLASSGLQHFIEPIGFMQKKEKSIVTII
jgi:selenide,water dikinase